jgi:hypothetical protein
MQKTRPQDPPPPRWHDFCRQKLIISIHLQTSGISGIKCVKSLKIKGLRFSARLSAFFPHSFRKLDKLKNMRYNQALPPPRPHPWACLKPLKIKRLRDVGKALKIKEFKFCLKLA